MKLNQAKIITCRLQEEGYEANIRKNYSGRGMYGETCVGIVTDAPLGIVGYVGGEQDIPLDDMPQRSDSMGLDTIVY